MDLSNRVATLLLNFVFNYDNMQYLMMSFVFVLPLVLRVRGPASANAKNTRITTRVVKFHSLILRIGQKITISVIDEKQHNKCILSGTLCSFAPVIINCFVDIDTRRNTLIIDINNCYGLQITYSEHDAGNLCYYIKWKNKKIKSWLFHRNIFEDCFEFLDFHWYGAGHVFQHFWPLEKWNTIMGPFVTGEADPVSWSSTYYGGVQERMWLCSSGIGVFVDEDIPLFVSHNTDCDSTLRIRSQLTSPYSSLNSGELSYHICQSRDVKEVTKFMHRMFINKPSDIPNEDIFHRPIWSTWAAFKTSVNQNKVLQFTDSIRKYGFEASQIEIDDDWTPHYGQFTFDENKFPNPKQMIKHIHEMGFKVSLWVHPFVSPLAKNMFRDRINLVHNMLGLPSLFKWWNGYAGILDITNPTCEAKFVYELNQLKNKFNIDSFKFDAGDACYLSNDTRTKQVLQSPNEYTTRFVNIVAEIDRKSKSQEVRVGFRNQSSPMFFRLQDKDSNWGYFNGIKTVIPHVLTQGLLGYPFVLPDMIGGNAYGKSKPDRELYIRWVQLNTLMPAMQFSIPPWSYDPEVIVITRKMLELRKQYSNKIVELAKEAVTSGYPICRPVWWISPCDEVALTIDSQFLLDGKWKDAISQKTLQGGCWHNNYFVGLADLPHFTKIEEINPQAESY